MRNNLTTIVQKAQKEGKLVYQTSVLTSTTLDPEPMALTER